MNSYAVPLDNLTGLTSPATTITSSEAIPPGLDQLPNDTEVLDAYDFLGVRFSPGAFMWPMSATDADFSPAVPFGKRVANFAGSGDSFRQQNPISIFFAEDLDAVAVGLVIGHGAGPALIEALNNGDVVESFYTSSVVVPNARWVGFTAVGLDELRISTTGNFLLDNLQLGHRSTSPPPLPSVADPGGTSNLLALLGVCLAGFTPWGRFSENLAAARFRGRR